MENLVECRVLEIDKDMQSTAPTVQAKLNHQKSGTMLAETDREKLKNISHPKYAS